MTYAQGRVINDADSHIMELPNFLKAYADPAVRDDIPMLPVPTVGALAVLDPESAAAGRHAAAKVAELVALGDRLIAGPKGHAALGAFNAEERTLALDLFGFQSQLVFPSFSAGPAFDPRRPVEARYVAAHVHNRAMADFCARDGELYGVSLLPLDEPGLALEELDHIVSLGLKAAWVPHRVPGDRSPGHNDFDPVWARLAEARHPVPDPRRRRADPGRSALVQHRPAGAEGLHGRRRKRARQRHDQPASQRRDLHRHPGAGRRAGAPSRPCAAAPSNWAPAGCRPCSARLDWIAEIWKRSEPELAAMKRRPVGAGHRADGVHADAVRERRRADPPVGRAALHVLQRLSAHRRRPRPDCAVRGGPDGRGETASRTPSTPATLRGSLRPGDATLRPVPSIAFVPDAPEEQALRHQRPRVAAGHHGAFGSRSGLTVVPTSGPTQRACGSAPTLGSVRRVCHSGREFRLLGLGCIRFCSPTGNWRGRSASGQTPPLLSPSSRLGNSN